MASSIGLDPFYSWLACLDLSPGQGGLKILFPVDFGTSDSFILSPGAQALLCFWHYEHHLSLARNRDATLPWVGDISSPIVIDTSSHLFGILFISGFLIRCPHRSWNCYSHPILCIVFSGLDFGMIFFFFLWACRWCKILRFRRSVCELDLPSDAL